MKRFLTILLTAVMIMSFVACGNTSNVKAGPVYTVEAEEVNPYIYPDDYPLIPAADFEAAFEILKEANMNAELTGYKDIVDIFGIDGAYYINNDQVYEDQLYKYYGWYADNEVGLIITFKADGDKLEYYAYSSAGIS